MMKDFAKVIMMANLYWVLPAGALWAAGNELWVNSFLLPNLFAIAIGLYSVSDPHS